MARWKFELADLSGRRLADITAIARNRALAYRLNGVSRLSFEVPADDPKIRNVHTDGYRYLEEGVRLVKGRRYELNPTTGVFGYKLRYLGLVWQVQDTGTENDAGCAVTCADLLVRLGKRYTAKRREFTATQGTTIGKTLVDEANVIAPTGIVTGTVEASPTRSVVYQWRQLLDAIGELSTSFDGFDLDLVPNDDPATLSSSNLATLNFLGRKGTVRPNAAFVWGAAGHNVNRVERLVNMDKLANVVTLLGATNTGGDQILSSRVDAASVAALGRYEDLEAFTEISTPTYLDALASDLIALSASRRELVQFVPAPGRSPLPFDNFDLGDTVPITIGDRLRGGLAGYQRVYGFDLVLDENARELVNGVYAKQE